MYQFIRSLLFTIDPENTHTYTINLGKLLQLFGPLNALWSWMFRYEKTALKTTLWGLEFPNPVGLAAGYDKNAETFRFLEQLNYGHIELGAVTYHPQAGNPKPRLFRLSEDQALINRMGFNGAGAEVFASNLQKIGTTKAIKMVNIGKSKIVENAKAVEDYLKTFTLVFPYADVFIVNVSSPNTPGLRTLQGKDELTKILKALVKKRKEFAPTTPKPILVKIAPDLTNSQIDDVLDVIKKTKIDGIVATNTTLSRPKSLLSKNKAETGGLSGLPLKDKATKIIRYIAKKTDGKLPIIGVGGIFTAEDAYEKIKAGASLVQIYTSMVYEGPALPKRICKGLVTLMEKNGKQNIADVVGKR
ncbi:MAG: quinone-dependent dihydroorotate dehydrogenase [bacterium]